VITNQILKTGIFPDKLKVAMVIPLYKSGEVNLIDNYRPVSLLASISKVVEKVVYTQLYNYMHLNKLLFDSQYGFRLDHSTELACLEFTDQIQHTLDTNKNAVTIFMDLSKAFDTLDHSIIISKLKFYGIRGTELSFFESYLYNRKQFVSVNSANSDIASISCGVPQGSVLGPLLFLIFMNDIPSSSNAFKFILYADDTTLISKLDFSHGNNRVINNTNLNKQLNQVYEWLTSNNLIVNIKKTKYMYFHSRGTNNRSDINKFTVMINEKHIERVQVINFLGLNIDENLNWKTHSNIISKKIAKYGGILNKLKHYLPTPILRILYFSMIQSSLNYCSLSWGIKNDRIFKLQKKIIRIISKSKYNAHTDPLFKQLNILKFNDMIKVKAAKFYFKYCNNRLPQYFKSFRLEPQSQLHSYNTRNNTNIRSFNTNTWTARKCLRHYLPCMVNNFSNTCNIQERVHTHSLEGFSQYIKTLLLSSYQSECHLPNCYICSRQ
jgi:hypothetical protein